MKEDKKKITKAVNDLEYEINKSEKHEKAVNLANKITGWTLGIGGGIVGGIAGLLGGGPAAGVMNGIKYGKMFGEYGGKLGSVLGESIDNAIHGTNYDISINYEFDYDKMIEGYKYGIDNCKTLLYELRKLLEDINKKIKELESQI